MSGAQTKRYSFGNAQNWLDDEPAPPAPAIEDREEFKRKTQEAAASVGYVAPSEQPAPVLAPAIEVATPKPAPAKVRKEARAKPAPAPMPEPEGKKGRPKGDRTVQMSVRIRQEHDDLIKAIAQDDFSVASIVEAALVAFAKGIYADKRYKRMPLDEDTLSLAKSIFSQHRQ